LPSTLNITVVFAILHLAVAFVETAQQERN
jgi:hypothetical protein